VARRVSIVLSILSLLCCVGILVFWYRSHRLICDVVSWQRPGGIAYAAVSKNDRLTLIRAKLSSAKAPVGFMHWVDINAALTDQNHYTLASHLGLVSEPTSIPRQWGGPEWGHPDDKLQGVGSERVPARCIFLPYWVLMLLFLTAPTRLVAAELRRWQRVREGRCVVCGYDLRATPDRCPECGTIPPR